MTYCALLFNGASVSPNGTVRPCCRYLDTIEGAKADDLDAAMVHPNWQAVRAKALAGERIAGCQKCYDEEAAGGLSLRLKSNHKYGVQHSVRVVQLDVNVSNHCTLACRMCSPQNSSVIAAEDRKHHGYRGKALLTSGFDPAHTDLSHIQQLEFLGGEPMLQQDTMLATLERVCTTHPNPASVEVSFTTNATSLPGNELAAMLERFPRRAVWFSIDAHGSLNDYIRFGSRFDQIIANLDWYGQRFGKKRGPFYVISAISAYNIHHLPRLAEFVKARFGYMKHRHHFVYGPEWLAAWVLPDWTKQTLIERYTHENPCDINIAQHLRTPSRVPFETFIQNTDHLDTIRNQKLAFANPQLAKIVNDYIVEKQTQAL